MLAYSLRADVDHRLAIKTVGFRVTQDDEVTGIDLAMHGETAYETLGIGRVTTEVKA